MNKVYLTQGPKVWLSKSVYMKQVNKQKNTKCDLKKVRKSVYRQTLHKRVDVYIGWHPKKTQDKTDTWGKTDEHRHKRQLTASGAVSTAPQGGCGESLKRTTISKRQNFAKGGVAAVYLLVIAFAFQLSTHQCHCHSHGHSHSQGPGHCHGHRVFILAMSSKGQWTTIVHVPFSECQMRVFKV